MTEYTDFIGYRGIGLSLTGRSQVVFTANHTGIGITQVANAQSANHQGLHTTFYFIHFSDSTISDSKV